MARRKCWFITELWNLGLGPNKARDIFHKTGLRPEVSEVLVKRFWHGLGVKELEGHIPGHEQNRGMKKWDTWTRNWSLEHPEEFTPEQYEKIKRR